MSGVGCCYIHISTQNIFLFPSFHLSWWYDSISIKRRMRGVNLGRKMIILIHVTILWWIFFSNLLSNYVHRLVMHLALMPLENFLHILYPIQWHLYMQLCTMSNNIRNEMSYLFDHLYIYIYFTSKLMMKTLHLIGNQSTHNSFLKQCSKSSYLMLIYDSLYFLF